MSDAWVEGYDTAMGVICGHINLDVNYPVLKGRRF
jgi:hypothetical protein